jgi:hypothetical protein
LASLQAFIDDSASDSGDRRLYLAGYLNRADRWAHFSVAWREELKAAPSIDYFKMSEANAFDGQFAGWTTSARDEKLRGLIRVINHFEPMSFEFSVSREEYYRDVKPVAPRGIGNPHFACCLQVVFGLAQYADSEKVTVPIDFIFDQQTGVSDDLALFLDYMKRNLPKSARKLIASVAFEDDKQFLPIQAADMLAWHLRREHESGAPLRAAGLLCNRKGHLVAKFDETSMKSISVQYSKLANIDQMQGPGQWRNLKAEIRRQSSLGFVPPHGSRWKNALYAARERMAGVFRSNQS